MRVIRLTTGRVCYLKPAYSRKPLPPGQTVAFASLPGETRVAIDLPERWLKMTEGELRPFVEAELHAVGRDTPIESAEAMAKLPRWRRVLVRLLKRWSPADGPSGAARPGGA